ncbi:MAG: hypothetical protein HYR84_05525, partial [Planctomycetes bacterium]|nr:hypothetical protein [Planctomycetota bacterium]
GIWYLVLALALVLAGTVVTAQDQLKPMTIQVVIGPDGAVKIIDAKTGKEISGDHVYKVQAKKIQGKPIDQKELAEFYLKLQKVLEIEKGDALDKKALEELHRALQELEKLKADKKGGDKKPGIIKPIEIEIELQKPGDEEPRVIVVGKKKVVDAGPLSVDQKLDLILKQLDELRRDVDGIKKRLDGKPSDKVRLWNVPGGGDAKPRIQVIPLPGGDKKIIIQRIQGLPGGDAGKDIKAEVRKRLEDALKKLDGDRPKPAPPANPELKRIEELERAIEAVRRQLEDARLELKKSKGGGK